MKVRPSFPSFNAVTAVREQFPKILAALPSFALAYAAVLYIVDRFEGTQEIVRGQHEGAAKENGTGISGLPSGPQYVTMDRRKLVLALQLLVGSLVTFGGSAYVIFALGPLGTAFGSGHLLTGLAGLTIGIAAVGKKDMPRNVLLGINILTIVYSAVSDAAAGALSLLPTSAFHDSVIGTLVAIIISSSIVYLVTRR
jgi:hypothetical protein